MYKREDNRIYNTNWKILRKNKIKITMEQPHQTDRPAACQKKQTNDREKCFYVYIKTCIGNINTY